MQMFIPLRDQRLRLTEDWVFEVNEHTFNDSTFKNLQEKIVTRTEPVSWDPNRQLEYCRIIVPAGTLFKLMGHSISLATTAEDCSVRIIFLGPGKFPKGKKNFYVDLNALHSARFEIA